MSLNSGKQDLKQAIIDAYTKAKDSSSAESPDPDAILMTLAYDLAIGIKEFMSAATVTTSGTISPGQMNALGGVYTAPGNTTGIGGPDAGAGGISFPDASVAALTTALEDCFVEEIENASKKFAIPAVVILKKSFAMGKAISAFALTAKVETTETVMPVPVVGTMVGPVMVPGTSAPWKGSGSGRLL